jgi:hypothetical protein
MNSEKIKIAIQKAYEELQAMSTEEFKEMLEKHKDGDYAKIIRESGMLKMNEQTITINLEDGKIVESYYQDGSAIIPIDTNSLIDLIIKANPAKKITVIKENGKITKWRK